LNLKQASVKNYEKLLLQNKILSFKNIILISQKT